MNFKNSKEFDENRVKHNQELILLLKKLSEENPSLRFSQLLLVFGFVDDIDIDKDKYWKDEFNVEPKDILKRVNSIITSRGT